MKCHSCLAIVTVFVSSLSLSPPAAAQQESIVVRTRGPVHEAFATAVSFNSQPTAVIPTEPPAPLAEALPARMPVGENIAWIPGYWEWDSTGDGYLWVSGMWRDLPPGREWVPGYWRPTAGGHQRIAGYWADSSATEHSYVPEPPEPVETGPDIESPGTGQAWVPGMWRWVDDRYRWQAGFWTPLHERWTYVPDHYRWTPRGHLHVRGYWDHAPLRRGVMFAPVTFTTRPENFRPDVVILADAVVRHLFIRTGNGAYHFGDYYDPTLRREGFIPALQYGLAGTLGFDPVTAHVRWSQRSDATWLRQRRDEYLHYYQNRDSRPPVVLAALDEMDGVRGARIGDLRYPVAAPLDRYVAAAEQQGASFRPTDAPARARAAELGAELARISGQRRDFEAAAAVERAESFAVDPSGRSPLRGRDIDAAAPAEGPPALPQGPPPIDPATLRTTPPERERTTPEPATDAEPLQPAPPTSSP
jgi:hypothetical protein